ncbi:MAG: peptide chain release factor N(5)-glutamine methyltransferase [Bdellovibrionia bacterium]
MKLNEVLQRTTQFFKEKKFDSPRLDAELILSHGLKLDRVQLYLKFDQPLAEDELEMLRGLVKRRVSGEPVAYILGYKDFYGNRFIVNEHTLIPRPETEELVEYVERWAQKNNIQDPQVIDLGAGTGCVGLSILNALSGNSKLWSLDISEGAIATAKKNAEQMGLTERSEFVIGNATDLITSAPQADIIVANPPYIDIEDPEVQKEVKQFEPHSALFAPSQGLGFLQDWSKVYSQKLNKPGLMIMEMGYQQGPIMKDYYQRLGIFKEVSVIKDLSGHDRFITGEL